MKEAFKRLCVMVPMGTNKDDVKEVAVSYFSEAGVFVEAGDLNTYENNTTNPYDWTVSAEYYLRRKHNKELN